MATEQNQITWTLADEGMDLFQRAGLAALYLSLKAAEEHDQNLAPLHWKADDLTFDSVTVRWKKTAKEALAKLFAWAWQVREGVLYLPGVHREDADRENLFKRLTEHNGIFRTFLQHTNVQPKSAPIARLRQLDEGKDILVQYQTPIIRERKARKGKAARKTNDATVKKLLKPWSDLDEFFDRNGNLVDRPVSLSSWVFPGVAPRYRTEEAWQGPAKLGLLLMVAPTVVLYQRLQGKGGNWILVVPDVRDLEEFDETRPRLKLDAEFVDVASLGDAALRFLAEYSTRSPRKRLCVGCRVVAMGKVGYYANQSIRKGILDVSFQATSVKRYRHLHRVLPNRYVPFRTAEETGVADAKEDERDEGEEVKASGAIRIPSPRGRIADNLVTNRPWYDDVCMPLVWDQASLERQRKSKPGKSLERIWFTNLCYQRAKIMKLIQEDDMWDREAEKVFVEAFWETLASLYAQEAAATQRGGARGVEERLDDLNEDIRRRLMHAKTRNLLRGALAELFAKAGRQRAVREHPAAIWRLADDSYEWKKARDLALLALASYQSKEKRAEAKASSTAKGE